MGALQRAYGEHTARLEAQTARQLLRVQSTLAHLQLRLGRGRRAKQRLASHVQVVGALDVQALLRRGRRRKQGQTPVSRLASPGLAGQPAAVVQPLDLHNGALGQRVGADVAH